MSSGTKTLCGQAFGTKQYHMLGIYLQRSWIVNFVTATLVVSLFCFLMWILKLLGKENDIAKAAESISLWFIPILYSYVFGNTVMQYPQSQLKNLVLGWLSTVVLILHVFLSWLFVYKLNWGVSGAMGAMSISTCSNTWRAFTLAASFDLWPVMKMSVSSGIMQCINIVAIVFMICLDFRASVSVRLSNELGEGDAKAVKYSVKINLSNKGCGRQTMAALVNFAFLLCVIGIPLVIHCPVGSQVWKTNWEEQVRTFTTEHGPFIDGGRECPGYRWRERRNVDSLSE